MESQREVLNWLNEEYQHYKQLQEIHFLTRSYIEPPQNELQVQSPDGVQIVADPFTENLMGLFRYIVYYEDIIKQYESALEAFLLLEKKFREYKAIRDKEGALLSGERGINHPREEFKKYLKWSEMYLTEEYSRMNMTAKEDLAYVLKKIEYNLSKLKSN